MNRKWLTWGVFCFAAAASRAGEPVSDNPIAASNALTPPPKTTFVPVPAAAAQAAPRSKPKPVEAPKPKVAEPVIVEKDGPSLGDAPAEVKEARKVVSEKPKVGRTKVAGPVTATTYVAPAPKAVVAEPVAPLPKPSIPETVPVTEFVPAVVQVQSPAMPPAAAMPARPKPMMIVPKLVSSERILPDRQRQMMPCEPIIIGPESSKPATMTASAPAEPARTVFAMVRSEVPHGAWEVDANKLRDEVLATCQGRKVACEVTMLPEKMLRVAVTVPSMNELTYLCRHLQTLTELGDYGLAVQATLAPQAAARLEQPAAAPAPAP